MAAKAERNGALGRRAASVNGDGAHEAPAVPVTISRPNFRVIQLGLVGTSPYMQNRFSQKAQNAIRESHEAGQTAKKGKKKEARDFKAEYEGAMHVSADGWHGVPASAFRAACIDVCRMVNFHMTRAKMSVFILADGYDAVSGEPLVRIHGKPEPFSSASIQPVRNSTGVIDLRARPVWKQWRIDLRVRFDADQFTESDVANLIMRAGVQVGIGEGRPFSKESNGIGFGCWEIQGGE